MLDSASLVELKASGNLPSPKGSALRVMELCQREDMTLPELIEALQVDPAMVGRILKLANSASFGRPRPVAALTPDVLMSVGVHAVSQMVLAFSLVSENRQGRCAGFDYETFWSRSVATAVAFQLIGTEIRAAAAGELFTVGLLANVGRLALASIHPDAYAQLLDAAGGPFAAAMVEREKHAFGYDHLEVAEAMMLDFGLPRVFTEAVSHHEAPGRLIRPPDSRATRMVHGLHLASRLAGLCFVAPDSRAAGYREILPLGQAMGVQAVRLAQIGDEMLHEWAEWSRLLDIPVRDLPSLAIAEASPTAEAPPQAALVLVQDPALGVELRRQLEAAGYAARVVRDARAALVEALDIQPVLAVVDLYDDFARALDFVQTLRRTEIGKLMHVLALQPADDTALLARALDAGTDDVLEKPVAANLLAVRLRAAARLIAEQQRLRQEREVLQRRLLELSIVGQHAREAALTDALTGTYNRRYAIDRLAQQWAEAQRGHRPFAVLMIDVDHFKQVNDMHGHDVGDAALCHVADLLRKSARLSDVVCRFGGEEFLVIAPDTAGEGAYRLAERMRTAVEGHGLTIGDRQIHLTVSVGVAERGDSVHNLQRLLKAADEALYVAKQRGRNRVERMP